LPRFCKAVFSPHTAHLPITNEYVLLAMFPPL
jgi:hypothetical protein